MENPTQPTSEGTAPTHNMNDREAFAMIRSLISEGHETNYERSKFADTPDDLEAVESESKALDRLNAWINERERAKPVRPWNGIDENTRDPLESDDDAPDVPSELDEIEPSLEHKTVEKGQTEKAEDALFDMIENTSDPCAQWELAQWLVALLPAGAVKDLAARREKKGGEGK